eukprot:GSChrysophyteH1.ASY1.ANO1.2116.1 assembled CDS
MPVLVLVVVICFVLAGTVASFQPSKPVMAWNTWNSFQCNISESLIKTAADKLVSLGLSDLGYARVNIDDWLKALGEYLHDKGLKFGLYSSAGFYTCAEGGVYPASLGMEDTDAMQFASWGVDYLKYDNCMEDKGRPEQRYRPMAQSIAKTGREIFLSLCEWGRGNPSTWGAQIGANSWRVSNDISDGWRSIITRAAINAPLWRYAGGAYLGGFNDPDMLEVGNGGCTQDEYQTHFSLWAIMKSPLILGMDLGALTVDSYAYKIITNQDVLDINQDAAAFQARRVFSDGSPPGGEGSDSVLATKCAWADDTWAYQDAPMSQVWTLRPDGKIESASSGRCLIEAAYDFTADAAWFADREDFDEVLTSLDMDTSIEFTGKVHEIENARGLLDVFGRPVRTGDCAGATTWDYWAGSIGGSIISKDSGLCLEVNTNNLYPLWQGKRLQTGRCDEVVRRGDNTATFGRDTQQHQSWVLDRRSADATGYLKNLYQHQCITVDADASAGKKIEIWQAPLHDGSYAVLVINLSNVPMNRVSVDMRMLQLDSRRVVKAHDLWSKELLPVNEEQGVIDISDEIPSHGSVFLRIELA